MISRRITIIVTLLAFALVTAVAAQENQAGGLVAGLRTAAGDDDRAAVIKTRSTAELNAACSQLANENAAARKIGNSDAAQANARLIEILAARADAPDCRAEALIEKSVGLSNHVLSSEYLREALKFLETSGNKKRQADVLASLHYTYLSVSDYEAARDVCERAVTLNEELKDYKRVIESLNGRGVVLMYQGDFIAAEKSHQRALQVAEDNKEMYGIASSAFHLGIIYRARGYYSDSLRVYQRARLLYEILARDEPQTYSGALSTCLRHIGAVYYSQGSNAVALEYFFKSLALDEAAKNKLLIAYSLLSIARVRFVEKNFDEALTLGERILGLFREAGDKEGTALALNLLGYTNQKLGNYDRAIDYFKQSLLIRETTGSKDGAAVARIGLASVYQTIGNHREAVESAEQAAAQFERNGNRELFWQTATVLGKSRLSLGERDKASAAFVKATRIIEDLRLDAVGGENERGVFFAGKVEPFQQTALMYAESGSLDDAFAAAERAKARILLDVLKFGRVEQSARLTAQERADENRLRNEIASLNIQLARANSSKTADPKLIAELQLKLEKVRLEYTDFQACAFADHPELKLQRGAVEPLAAKDIGELLDEKNALLEYLVTPNETLLFVFTKTAGKTVSQIYRLPIKQVELSARINRFRQKIATANLLFAADARMLYELLLKPAERQLKNKTRLVIAPDDGLWELPFQALQSEENHYLLDDAAISYAPSMTILRELNNRGETAGTAGTLLAFGNPTAANNANLKINFAALPEAERQVSALRSLFPANQSRILLRGAAGENTFKMEAPNFRIVHLATHGFLDNNNPLNSYVLLAPDRGEDGRLEAREILEMKLRADLVVLSACETARGTARSGEGMIGLAWSLMVAGTRSVAVSQWKVESASTTELMQNFYQTLQPKTGKFAVADKAAALREAALKLRRDERFAHPFYWAGFVLIGETN